MFSQHMTKGICWNVKSTGVSVIFKPTMIAQCKQKDVKKSKKRAEMFWFHKMYNQIPGQMQGERPVVWGGALRGEVGERLPCCYLPSWGVGFINKVHSNLFSTNRQRKKARNNAYRNPVKWPRKYPQFVTAFMAKMANNRFGYLTGGISRLA